MKNDFQAVVMSGADNRGRMDEAIRLGAVAKVEKPFKDVLEIFRLVEYAIRVRNMRLENTERFPEKERAA